ncbi:MAG: winged helix-turn-helix domain-containing protein [Candidatus Eremiobacteraeota bacterium]|nr:winged helix-turn-helix domain-containing protein [Candidatus Eremiobacteraeota bacterium]
MEQPVFERSLIYGLGPYELDAHRLLLLHGGEPISLGPKVVETLLALLERSGEVMTKDELLDRIWPEGYVEEANLAQNIYVLRKTLAVHWNVKPIETIPRRGYRLTAPVTVFQAPAEPRPSLQLVAPIEPAATTNGFAKRRWAAAIAAAAILLGIASAVNRPALVGARTVALTGAAAQSYTLGRYYWNLRTPQGLAKSIPYFNDVIRRAPNSAVGYAGLGDVYMILAETKCHKMAHNCNEMIRAKSYIRRALQADPNSAEAHTAHALTLETVDGKYQTAEAEYRRAIALDPKYALAHQWYGTSLLMRGERTLARHELEASVALEPVATAANAWLGIEAYFDHRYAASVTYNRLALDLDPNRMDSALLLGLSQEQLSDYNGALASFHHFAGTCKCRAQAQLLEAALDARMGRRAVALEAINSAIATSHDVPMDEVAIAFIALGDHDRALSYMRKVHFKDHSERVFLALDPRLDPVRSDARFRAWTSAG